MLDEIRAGGLDAVLPLRRRARPLDRAELELDSADDRCQRGRARSGAAGGPRARRRTDAEVRHRGAQPPHRLRDRARSRRVRRAPLHPGAARRRLPAGRPVPDPRQRLHDRRGRQGGRRSDRPRVHSAQPGRRAHPAVLYAAYLSGVDRVFVARWGPGARRDGLRPPRRASGRHARRCRQRLRHRGQAPALRHGGDRPACRPVRGRRHRRRDRRPGHSSPPTSSARPSTARSRRQRW